MELLNIDFANSSVDELLEKRNRLKTMLRRPIDLAGHDKESVKNAIQKLDSEIKKRGRSEDYIIDEF